MRLNKTIYITRSAMLLALLMAVVGSVMMANVKVDHLTKKDGLGGSVVSDLFQDREGYIWIGTWEGLSRYDGYEFVNYTKNDTGTDGDFHNRVVKIHQDSLGNIWFTSYNDALVRLNSRTEKLETAAELLSANGEVKFSNPLFASDGTVWAIAEVTGPKKRRGVVEIKTDPQSNGMTAVTHETEGSTPVMIYQAGDRTVWLATDNGLRVLKSEGKIANVIARGEKPVSVAEYGGKLYWGTADGKIISHDKKTDKITVTDVSPGDPVRLIVPDSRGKTIYAGTEGGKLISYSTKDKTAGTITAQKGPVEQIFVDSHGLVWTLTAENGVTQYDPETGKTQHFTQEPNCQVDAPTPMIVEKEGQLWVSMTGGGFGRYDRETNSIVPLDAKGEDDRPLPNVVKQLLVTSADQLWLATPHRGLDRVTLSQRKINYFNPGNQTGHHEVKAFCIGPDSTVWLGSKTGELYIYGKDGTLQRTISRGSDGLPIGRIYDLKRTPDGTVWIANRVQGLISMKLHPDGSFSTERFRHNPSDRKSLSNDGVQSLLVDSDGRLWVATYGGGVNIMMNGGFLNPGNNLKGYPSMTHSKVRALAEDGSGNVWAATTEGLVKMQFDEKRVDVSTEVFRHERNDSRSLPANDILTVFADRDHNIWVGTTGGGLSRYDGNGGFETYTTADGLPSDYVQAITEDEKGNLWIATEEDVVCFNKNSRRFFILSEMDGLGGARLTERGAFALPGGKVIFGTIEGSYIVDAASLTSGPGSGFNLRLTRVRTAYPGSVDELTPLVVTDNVINLPDRRSQLELTVASLNYPQQNRTVYQWQLDGGDWQTADGHTILLNSLPSGEHKLTLRCFIAGNPDESESLELTLNVPVAWWQRWQIWIVILIVAAGLAALFFLVRKRRLKRLAEEKEQREREEAEKQQENERRQAEIDAREKALEEAEASRAKSMSIAPDEIVVETDEDETFMKKVLEWLEKNYTDPDMKIEEMVAATGYGRTTFYNRLKSLVNASPVDFVIDFRMKKARMLMERSRKTIAEIAYLTGYADPHYFTRAYKNRYGETPTQYRTRLKKQTGQPKAENSEASKYSENSESSHNSDNSEHQETSKKTQTDKK